MGVSFEFHGTDRFVVQRQLGVGGMGVVYLAFDREQNTRVALKTLRMADPQALYRFKQEFRALQHIEHPNLVSLGELIEEGGRWFFTMELVDGCDFLAYVRPDQLDVARLRAALGQLATGLVALHDAGKVHRDIKPTNVRVTPAGRVVLLDFGLVADTQPASSDSTSDPKVVGTAAYMAPEQAASKPPSTAADWYGVGAVLYEALTGKPPFEGPALQIFMDKQKREPPPPRSLATDAPPDLDALCRELLQFAPDARPRGHDVLRRLGVEASDAAPAAVSVSFTQTAPFVGRGDELTALREAFVDTREGRPVTVFVHGESGVGKSALIREFADEIAAKDGDAVELVGRCYERESVPYKAFDGIVDALSRYVRRLSEAEAAALLPRHASLLARVFPILGRVEAIAQAPQPLRQIRDPHELRSRAFGALRELMTRIAEAHPLILVIDDLQWADADSLLLLGDLVRPPDAPPLLLLISSREDQPQQQLPGDVRAISVEPLDPGIARELALLLLARAELDDADAAAAIADEAAGHPLYIDELVRHAAVAGEAARRGLHLGEAIWARVQTLPAEASAILELVCAADAPLPQETVQLAARLEGPEFARTVALLRVANLVRGSGRRGTESIQPYHDRVREAVLQHLDADRRAEHERRLAIALETGGAATERPALLLRYLEATGQGAKAARYATDAARRATSALAFDNAVEFYRTALRVGDHDEPTRRELRIEMAEALINAGRGALAAAEFMSLVPGASAADALELQRRAATEYLRAGHIDTGLETLTQVLAAVGLRLARTGRRAIASLAWRRAQLKLRGLGFKRRDTSQISEEELRRIDICWTAAVGLGTADTIRAADFQTRHLLLALRAGEPYRIARALTVEIAFTPVGRRGRARAERIIATASRLCAEIGDPPELVGWVEVTSALADYQAGNFISAREHARQAVQIFREQCTGVAYELASAEMVHLWTIYHTGQLGDLSRTVHRVVAEARRRGDVYALTALRSSVLNAAWLLDGDVEGARRAADEATELLPQGWFHLQHYWSLVAHTHIDLYRADGRAALARVHEAWRELERSQLLRLGILRVEALCLRARAALAAAAHDPACLREVERDARRIERQPIEWARPLAAMMRGELAAARGEMAGALALYRRAANELTDHGLELYAQAARRRRGELLGGSEGLALADKVDAWFREHGAVEPVHFARMVAPVAASN